MRHYVNDNFADCAWKDIKMENLCGEPSARGGAPDFIKFTPTQEFVRRYFTPRAPVKGMLLQHSVGTGKTCSAIAAASYNFEPNGYTILWVTRTTLKNDIWKNMFDQICSAVIKRRIEEEGITIPNESSKRMRLLSKSWAIKPMSYKQFSNLVSQENHLPSDFACSNCCSFSKKS
jgi:Rad3-related DNA helicase